jgi:predicted CXXCH cytochrome family protein
MKPCQAPHTSRTQAGLLPVLLAAALLVSGWTASMGADSRHQARRSMHRGQGSLLGGLAKSEGTPYHYGVNLVCSDCHTMHYSQAHTYGSDGSGTVDPMGGAGPYPRLLKNDVLDLCVTCHDNHAGIPDVMGADVNGLQERSAGFFAPVDQVSPHGHDLGRNAPTGEYLCDKCHTYGGGGASEDKKVTCIDCHSVHGNGNPRNLQWASYPEGTPPLGLFTAAGASGVAKYERHNTAYGTLNTAALREVSNMCIDCHHTLTGAYYNDPNGDGIHSRHPSYESERDDQNNIAQGLAGGTSDPAHWIAGVGSGFDGALRVPFVTSGATNQSEAAVIDPESNGVFCLSCHKAHGSDNPFGLVWAADTGAGPKGCDQCHAKADSEAP